jgi:AraC family cel operon transcriptional repressor
MKTYFYPASVYVNEELGYTCRHNYSGTENFQLHYHDYYEIFLMISGEGIHYVNGERKPLTDHSLIFIRPSDTHTYIREQDKKFSFINLTFTKETFENLFSYIGNPEAKEKMITSKMPPLIFVEKLDKEKLLSRFEALNTLNWEEPKKREARMKLLLMDIFVNFFIGAVERKDNAPSWLEMLTEKMNHPSHFSEGIPKMLELSGYSREHLSRSVKKHLKVTLSEFINSLRINWICNMLINTDVPITDLCFEAGFSSLSYFYRVFKAAIGITPADFRERHTT